MPKSRRQIHLESLKGLLKPIARFCLRRSIKLQEIIEMVKQALFEVAIEDLNTRGDSVNVSKLSLMTGIHRKDGVRLMNFGAVLPEDESLLTRIIGHWRADARFIAPNGKPKILKYNGKDSDFYKLVHSVSRELNPMSILSELERVGAVTRIELGLKLLAKTFVPKGDEREALVYLISDTEDLHEAIEGNISNSNPLPNLHIKTEFDKIPDEFVDQIREWILKEGTDLHDRAQSYIGQYDKDLNPKMEDYKGENKLSLVGFSRSVKLKSTTE